MQPSGMPTENMNIKSNKEMTFFVVVEIFLWTSIWEHVHKQKNRVYVVPSVSQRTSLHDFQMKYKKIKCWYRLFVFCAAFFFFFVDRAMFVRSAENIGLIALRLFILRAPCKCSYLYWLYIDEFAKNPSKNWSIRQMNLVISTILSIINALRMWNLEEKKSETNPM